MPRASIVPLDLTDDRLELASGLSAVAAGVLWFWVYLMADSGPELCSTAPRLLEHCPLCYLASAATLVALAGGLALIQRRRRR
jgi:hypothetical protein